MAAAAWLALASTLPAAAAGKDPAQTSAAAGEALYVEKCAMCHRAGGMGAGLLARRTPPKGQEGQEILENRTHLSATFVRSVVRQGLSNMPPLSRAEVSDAQLDSIAAYLAKGNP